MMDVCNGAAGRGVWSLWGDMEAFAFEARVAVDVSGDFHSLREGDVLSVHDRNDHACRGAGAFALVAGAQDGLIIVREADASDKNTELPAAAECSFWFRFVDDAHGVGTNGNYEEAIDNDVF